MLSNILRNIISFSVASAWMDISSTLFVFFDAVLTHLRKFIFFLFQFQLCNRTRCKQPLWWSSAVDHNGGRHVRRRVPVVQPFSRAHRWELAGRGGTEMLHLIIAWRGLCRASQRVTTAWFHFLWLFLVGVQRPWPTTLPWLFNHGSLSPADYCHAVLVPTLDIS